MKFWNFLCGVRQCKLSDRYDNANIDIFVVGGDRDSTFYSPRIDSNFDQKLQELSIEVLGNFGNVGAGQPCTSTPVRI